MLERNKYARTRGFGSFLPQWLKNTAGGVVNAGVSGIKNISTGALVALAGLTQLDQSAWLARKLIGQTPSTWKYRFTADTVDLDVWNHLLAATLTYTQGTSEVEVPANYKLESINMHMIALYLPSGSVILGYRGTKSFNDVLIDICLTTGIDHERFHKDVETTCKWIHSHSHLKVTLAGHSLGGSIALFVGRELNLQGHVFNPGPEKNSAKTSLPFTIHMVATDPVSCSFVSSEEHNYVIYGGRDASWYNSAFKMAKALHPLGQYYTAVSKTAAHVLSAFASSEELNTYFKKSVGSSKTRAFNHSNNQYNLILGKIIFISKLIILKQLSWRSGHTTNQARNIFT